MVEVTDHHSKYTQTQIKANC